MFLPQCERQSFTPTQNKRQSYGLVFFNLYIFLQQAGRQKILRWTAASIPREFNLLLISSLMQS